MYGSDGQFIGGCNCGCDWHSISNPYSSQFCPPPKEINYDGNTFEGDCSCTCPKGMNRESCAPPLVWDEEKCSCQCPQTLYASPLCPAHQIFDSSVCHCVCDGIGSPGGPCIGSNGQMLMESTVNADCSCDCPAWSATAADCAATGRVLKQCECTCPDMSCPGQQSVDKVSCTCGCPPCADGYMITDAYTCQCVSR